MKLGYLPVQRSQWHNWLRSHQASELVILVFCKCQQVSRPVFCKCQQGSGLRLVFCKCQQAQNWDLAVFWFRGRNDITGWDSTKLQKLVILVFCKYQRVSRPVFCRCQQGSGLRLVFCKCQQAQNRWYLSFVNVNKYRDWDLAVCWFRGRDDVTNWDATKLNGRWDLAICQFRGRNDITGWEATKLNGRWNSAIFQFRGRDDVTGWEATKLKIGDTCLL